MTNNNSGAATGRINPDTQLHVFKTFLGMPPDADTPPVCGAVLTSAYNGKGAPECPTCGRILRRARREAEVAQARDHRARRF